MSEPIGEIPVVISGDYSTLQRDLQKAETLAREAGAKIGAALSAGSAAYDAAGGAASGYGKSAQSIIDIQKRLDAELVDARSALVEVQLGYEAGALSANALARAEMNAAEATRAADIALQRVADSNRLASEATKKHSQELQQMFSAMQQAGLALTAAVTLPIVGLGLAAVKMSEQLNQAQVAFTGLFGSAQKASAFIQELKAFALATPFEFTGLVETAKHMLALGFAAKDVIPMLRTIGDAVAVLGGGQEKIDRITKAFADLNAKGKVSAQEMRQFAEAGINAWKLLADSIGTTVPEAMKMAEKGVIEASVAIPAILKGMNDQFKGQMDQMSKTLTGVWTQFQEQSAFILADIGKTLTPVMKSMIEDVGKPLLEWTKKAAEGFAALDPAVQQTVIALAGLGAAAGPALAALGLMAQGFVAVKAAAVALGLSLNAIPWVLIATGVLTLANAMWKLHEAEDANAKAGDDQVRSIQKMETHLKSLGINLGIASNYYHTGQMSAEMYMKSLIALARAHGDTVTPIKDLGSAVTASEAAARRAAAQAALHAAEIKKLGQAHKETKNEIDIFIEAFQKEFKEAIPTARELAEAVREISAVAMDEALGGPLMRANEGLRQLQERAVAARAGLEDMVPSDLDDTLTTAEDGLEGVTVGLEEVTAAVEATSVQARELSEDVKFLLDTWDNANQDIARGIARLVVDGGKLKDVSIDVAKQIAGSIVQYIVEGALKQLKAAILENIDLFGKFGKTAADAAKEAVKVPGIPGTGGSKAPSGGTPSTGGGSGGALSKAGDIAGVVSAVSDIIGNFQFYAMNKSLDIIVKHTLETVNELRNWRRDAWEQQTNLFYKLDDMWNEIRNVVDVLKLIGLHGGGGGGDTSAFLEDFIKLINSRPASADGSTQALLDAQEKAYQEVIHASDGVSYGFQSLTPQIENLDRAISNAGTSFSGFVEDTKSVAAMLSPERVTGFHGYDATPGSGNNSVTMIKPADVYGFHGYDATPGSGMNAITGTGNIFNRTQGFAPGNNAGEKVIGVQVIAVDPSGRQITNAVIKGLEERGKRVL